MDAVVVSMLASAVHVYNPTWLLSCRLLLSAAPGGDTSPGGFQSDCSVSLELNWQGIGQTAKRRCDITWHQLIERNLFSASSLLPDDQTQRLQSERHGGNGLTPKVQWPSWSYKSDLETAFSSWSLIQETASCNRSSTHSIRQPPGSLKLIQGR